jgi:hypothetical protein
VRYGVNEQATFTRYKQPLDGFGGMDHQGNLAVGYSISSTTVFPGVRYAGRLAGDPPNGLFQGEATMQSGGFVQVNTASRWGDYSSTNLDPIDDCTFWHTNEYYLDDQPGITAEWHTRIGNFKVNPLCTAPAQGTLQVNVTNCATACRYKVFWSAWTAPTAPPARPAKNNLPLAPVATALALARRLLPHSAGTGHHH